MLKEPEKDCRGSKRLPAKLLLSGTAYFENRPVAVKGPGASTALINAPLQMTHHLLSARRVKGQLRRPGSCSESPLSNVHDHETYSRYHYISMISVCWGGMILFSIYCLRVVLMSFLAIPHNGKFCDPSACFLKNKKDGIACRPSCRHTATLVACSIAGRKSWNKALLPATSLHAVNLFYSSAILR